MLANNSQSHLREESENSMFPCLNVTSAPNILSKQDFCILETLEKKAQLYVMHAAISAHFFYVQVYIYVWNHRPIQAFRSE